MRRATLPAAAEKRARPHARTCKASPELSAGAACAIDRTRTWLAQHQHSDGYWCGELEGDTILESEYILLLAWLGREAGEVARRAARYIEQKALPEGGWPLYPGGPLDVSVSVKAYFALKLTGYDPQSDLMQRAGAAIRAAGGADRVNSFTRFYLALLDQISYDHCPAVPPEMVLLPSWAPLNIYRISAWSRTILVPLSIMWAHRPVRKLPPSRGIRELFLEEPENWPPLRAPGLEAPASRFSWDGTFRRLDGALKWAERSGLRPLRSAALRSAEAWMLERFSDSDGLGAIFPPIIWSVVALKCLGYRDDHPDLQECHRQLEGLMIDEGETLRLQPCKSPVWDTALTVRALAAAGDKPDDPGIGRAVDWLRSKEVRQKGDWAVKVRAEPAGWFFEHHNQFYPDLDDTSMVLMALVEAGRLGSQSGPAPADSASMQLQPALRWTLAMQNRDGGWGAFDRDNDMELLCHVPFADHNAMIDPSTPDITARVLECLAMFGYRVGDSAVDRAVNFVRQTQAADGSWFGRWGVNYLYGTWQVLVGLVAVGVPSNDPAIGRGAQWLLGQQHDQGSWGESADSYADAAQKGIGPPTASQTAWALWGLIAAGKHQHPAVQRGVQYLIDAQRPDGSWEEDEFTGTGFPLVFYLRYHMYPIYFPLLALARWREALQD